MAVPDVTPAPRTPSASGHDFVTVPEDTEERRSFLQARIALFGKMLAIITSGFLAISASSYFVFTPEPSVVTRLSRDRYDLAAIAMMLGLWLVARRGRLPKLVLELLEAGVTILSCLGYAIMVLGTDEEFNLLAPSLSALAILLGRAVFIPTGPRRTFFVSLVASIPAVVVTYSLATRLDAHTSIPHPIGPTIYVACWAGMSVALSTVTSRIIYGLEQKVREARQLGQYTLAERVGEGGMGVAYRAHHAMLRRPTAIKVLPPDKMGQQNILRFEREVQLTSQLTHPNTICIYDYGRTPDGLFYYAMEYLEGYTLTELVEATGPLAPARLAWLMRQVAGSLDEAHRIGLIHRDIKPDNVIVCERGGLRDVVKVLDFGLVKEFNSSDPAVSQVDAMVGTPLYMSPESFTAPSTVGVASDLYALGALAYFLATGRHVFEGRTFAEICAHHISTAPAPLSPRIPPSMERLILDCLAKAPEARPPSAAAIEQAFSSMGAWSQEDARAWWQAHGDELARVRGREPPAVVDLARASTVLRSAATAR